VKRSPKGITFANSQRFEGVLSIILPEWRSKYLHLMMRRGRKTAKVAMARKLAVRLYWMMRQGWDYQQWSKFGSHAGQPGHRHGVQ
jgi:hypothetical protein